MNKLEIPNLDRWRAGELPDEVLFNELQDALEFLLDPPTVKVYRTSTQSIPSAGSQAVVWQAVEYDNCKSFGAGYTTAMWDPATPDRIYARVGGWYDVFYTVSWDDRVDDSRRVVLFQVNGISSQEFGRRDVWHENDYDNINCLAPVFLNAGDYVTMLVYQASGSSTNINPTTFPEPGRRTMTKMRWVSL